MSTAAPTRARPAPAAPPRRWSRTWWAGWLPLPTGRAAGLLAVLALAVAVAPYEAGGVIAPAAGSIALVAVGITADGWLAPAPWRVGVDRQLPTVVALGRTAEIVWRLSNPARRRLTVAVADELAPSLRPGTRRVATVLPAAGQAVLRTVIEPQRRGSFTPTTVTVRVSGPLGLGFRQASRRLPSRIEVHPSFRSTDAAELRIRRARILEHGVRTVRGRGGGTEFEALRDHLPGDEFRDIDWAATARAGRPVVRTYRPERNQQVLVLLDTGRLMAGLVSGVPRLEHGMDAAMALATVAQRLGDRTGLIAFAAEVRALVPPQRTGSHLRQLSRALHDLEPQLVESGYLAAFRSALVRFRRRALMVVITELGAEAAEETLLPALHLVARDHAVLVAAARDPAVTELRDAEVRRPNEAYGAAAATRVLGARQRVTARLHAMGVRVVDAEPGALPARLADAYLEVKSAGSL